MTQTSPTLRHVSKQFQSLLQDSERTIDSRVLSVGEIPETLLDKLPKEDVYLVSAYLTVGADLLVTTDRGLFDSLSEAQVNLSRAR